MGAGEDVRKGREKDERKWGRKKREKGGDGGRREVKRKRTRQK